ncbi:hypothetical protein H9Q13_01795 [Pontibacter sp. JH31]|uniref:Uncharacterized protein n=1 Tax=Pontibacter aquaedesilientis TaxID=2766980 RepID=A0ABR7XC49_9BACT|nr:hypothetical protein [Pontibacter aquaedesilientis]MBD1395883.1 hypothetical protein [Pontibacter aquaedesilientis]
MDIYENSAVITGLESGCCAVSTTFAPPRNGHQEEDSMEYATIDGEVVTCIAGASALEKGAGIMIGDYFVGILESLSGLSSKPFLRY